MKKFSSKDSRFASRPARFTMKRAEARAPGRDVFAASTWLAALTLVLLAAPQNSMSADLRNVTLKITRTNPSTAEISWQSKSAVPSPGLQLVPDYQLETSANLSNWTAVGSQLVGTTNAQTLRAFDSINEPAGFYRVKSIIRRPFGKFNQANLSRGELAEADFFGAEFFAANLSNANLDRANLRGTDLRFADLTDATANGADLFATDLLLATMAFAVIERADLSFANLEGADLFAGSLLGSDLRSAILTGADLRFLTLHQTVIDSRTLLDARWMRVWQLVNGMATNTAFTNVDLSFADLRGAGLRSMNFSGSDFNSSILNGADLRGANFTNANLRFVAFAGALLDSSTIIDTKSRLAWEIVTVGAEGRDLHGTNLSSTFLAFANMQNVNLTNANLSLAVMFQTDLRNSNLRNANFGSTDLRQANLLGCVTNGANFIGATFGQTIMPDGSIR